MATFVKLSHVRTEQPGWVNLDLVQFMKRLGPSRATTYSNELPERTLIVFGPPNDGDPFSNSVEVLETPEEILAAGGIESPCPVPHNCSYVSHYLAYGPADLTHAGFHAAEKLAEQHMAGCRLIEMKGGCSTCQRHEERLRA